jgi:hypothetical protein
MLNQQTLDKLYIMKLLGMADGFKEQLQQPSFQDLSFDQRFGMLVDGQWTWKENKRLKRLLKDAKLKLQACVEDIDYKTSPPGSGKPFSPVPSLKRPVAKDFELSICVFLSSSIRSLLPGPMAPMETS